MCNKCNIYSEHFIIFLIFVGMINSLRCWVIKHWNIINILPACNIFMLEQNFWWKLGFMSSRNTNVSSPAWTEVRRQVCGGGQVDIPFLLLKLKLVRQVFATASNSISAVHNCMIAVQIIRRHWLHSALLLRVPGQPQISQNFIHFI